MQNKDKNSKKGKCDDEKQTPLICRVIFAKGLFRIQSMFRCGKLDDNLLPGSIKQTDKIILLIFPHHIRIFMVIPDRRLMAGL